MGSGGGPLATHHARPGVGDTALVGHPLVHGPLFVCKGSQEGPAHVVHAVHTHCGALEDATAGKSMSGVTGPEGPRLPHLATSRPSPGSGEHSIEQRGPAVPGGQQEHVLCGEGAWLGEGTQHSRLARFQDLCPCPPVPHSSLHSWHSRSWSKCVSPSMPGTEHTSRAFRNVVHLLTRLR